MKLRSAPRKWAVTLALALACVMPAAALADAPAPIVAEPSLYGALMAIACGASTNVARHAPLPIVIAVTIAACTAAYLDAMSAPDPR